MARDISFLVPGGALAGPLLAQMLQEGQPPSHLAPGTRLGTFEIDRLLARGGAGAVYLAHRHTGFDQRVALKVVRASSTWRRRFEHEQDLLGRLSHRAIVRIFDAGETGDYAWLAMEYVDGQPIDRSFAGRRLPWRARVAVLMEICRALNYAHRELVVHGDLKPTNILIDDTGEPRLVDFGIATDLRTGDAFGGHVYTPGFASPEQRRGERLGAASDIWQCGKLIERLCLEAPAAEGGLRGARGADWPRRDLEAIAARATADSPGARYDSAAALADDLFASLQRRQVTARGSSRAYRLCCFLRRHRLAVAIGALLWTLLGAGLIIALHQARIARDNAEAARRVTRFVVSMIEAGNPESGNAEQSVEAWLQDAAGRVDEALKDLPAAQAQMNAALGVGLATRGRQDEGIEALERAVAQWRTLEQPVLLANTLNQLAMRYRAAGRLDAAQAAAMEALQIHQSRGAGVDADVLAVRTTLARLAGQRGDYDLQLAMHRANLDDRAALFGRDDPRLAVDWNNLGAALLLRARYREARHAFEEVLRLLRSDPQAPKSRQAWAQAGLGSVLRALGRYDAAEAAYLDAEAIMLRTLHDQHPHLGIIHIGLAMLRRDQGRFEAALGHAERALSILEPLSEPDRHLAYWQAGLAHLDLGEPERAHERLAQAYRLVRELRGEDDPQALVVRAAVMATRVRQGNAAALAAVRDAVARLAEHADAHPQSYTQGLELLAAAESAAGDEAAAGCHRQRRHTVLLALLGPEHPQVRSGFDGAADAGTCAQR